MKKLFYMIYQSNSNDPDTLLSWFFPHVIEMVAKRYQASAQKSLLHVYELDKDFLQFDPEFVRFALNYREQLLQVVENPVLVASLLRFFVSTSLEFTYKSNQFIEIDENDQAELYRIYEAYLLRIKDALANSQDFDDLNARLEAAVVIHFHNLKTNISRFFDPQAGPSVRSNLILNQVVCAQYSSDFQLKLFGLDLNQLISPVLDIGCGKTGQLVKYLVSKGIDACGFDRLVEPADMLFQADWLQYSFVPGTWGTVLSHMAFSNHFIFNHIYANGDPYRYARQYMAILNSLKPGGTFCYTPSLPFMETLLPPDRFLVKTREILPSEPQSSHFLEISNIDMRVSVVKRIEGTNIAD